jgi:O-methyltransferase
LGISTTIVNKKFKIIILKMKKTIVKAIKKFASLFGIEIRKAKKNVEHPKNGMHDRIVSYATYSPWNIDQEFIKVWSSIQPYTLVDKLRCYELWKLVEQCSKLDSGHIMEIGVWRGGTGVLIARQAKNSKIKESVFLCDTFKGVVKAGLNDATYEGGEHADTGKEMVEKLLSENRLDNVEILEGIFPEQTATNVENLKFRFVHIDVDVYQSAKDVNEWIWNRLLPGGVIVYDDYGFASCDGITKYVEEQTGMDDRIIIHNLNGHAIVVKTK